MTAALHKEITNAIARVKVDPTYIAYSALANLTDSAPDLGFPQYRISILRNFTIEPLIPVIKGEAMRLGVAADVRLSDFDAIAESVFNSQSQIYSHDPHLMIMAQWPETWSPALTNKFLTLTPEQIDDEVERVVETTRNLIQAIRLKSTAPLIINNFLLPTTRTLGILDFQSESHQTHVILRLNRALLEMSKSFPDVYWIDLMSLFSRVGYDNAVDQRNWHIARAPLSKNVLVPLGLEYAKFIRALSGKTRKCLVLDCDNTLWGGVIGEDGLDGIKLGQTHPGSSFVTFQQECLNLYNRGVILALCSKNNEADVLDVFKNHPDTVLKEHHFATWQVNWDDKATNIRRIADELNIDIDSLVFVDDNAFECDWVRSQLPQVEVIHLPKEPFHYRRDLISPGFFDSLAFSSEDKKRSTMYVSDNQRKQRMMAATSLEDYLVNLNLRAEIGRPNKDDLPRISQLTQKTNQFNVTTKRYTEGDIERFFGAPNSDVFFLRLADRISELGLIGVAIVEYRDTVADIDSLLLSCRALGRGAEEVLLCAIQKSAATRACKKLTGTYLMSKKNMQVSDFYEKHGFTLAEKTPHGTRWELALEGRPLPNYPNWINVLEINT